MFVANYNFWMKLIFTVFITKKWFKIVFDQDLHVKITIHITLKYYVYKFNEVSIP